LSELWNLVFKNHNTQVMENAGRIAVVRRTAISFALCFLLLLSVLNLQNVNADSLPPGTSVTTGPYPEGGEIHVIVVSNLGPQTISFPNPSGDVIKLFSSVTTSVSGAVLYFDSAGITYSQTIAPNSNTMLTFPSSLSISNVRVSIANRGFPDDAVHVGYFYSTPPQAYDPTIHGFSFSNSDFTDFENGKVVIPTLVQIRNFIELIPELRVLPPAVKDMLALQALLIANDIARSDGYCYGMSKTSVSLFESGESPPVSEINQTEAMVRFETKIKDSQSAQFTNVIKNGLMALGRTSNEEEVNSIKAHVSPSSPRLISLGEDSNSAYHSLVAYDIETNSDGTIISAYDPNDCCPASPTQIELKNDFSFSYLSGTKAIPPVVPAGPFTKLADAESIDDLIESINDLFQNAIMFEVHSPVDIAVINEGGQYVGVMDGQFSQGFQAFYESDGENKLVLITDDIGSNYKVILTGTGAGAFTFESLAHIAGHDTHEVLTGISAQGEKIVYDVTVGQDGSLVVIPPTKTNGTVGGIIEPVDATALLVAGTTTNLFWILLTVGGSAVTGLALLKIKRKHS
jgi:hypothetical protein